MLKRRVALSKPLPTGIGARVMLYEAYQAQSDLMAPVKAFARLALEALNGPFPAFKANALVRNLSAAYEMIDRAGLTHSRPPYGIKTAPVGNEIANVTEEAALKTPFATLVHFKKDVATPQPRVLVVAPLSGPFRDPAALDRETLLPIMTSISPTGTTPATSASPTAPSASTITSLMSSSSSNISAPAPMSSPSASPACRCSPPPRSWPRTTIRARRRR